MSALTLYTEVDNLYNLCLKVVDVSIIYLKQLLFDKSH